MRTYLQDSTLSTTRSVPHAGLELIAKIVVSDGPSRYYRGPQVKVDHGIPGRNETHEGNSGRGFCN